MKNTEISESKLEIHYWLNNNSHSMNAFIINKCEYEILGLIKEVSKIYGLEVKIEAQAYSEGGIIKWLKIISKEENKKATITTSVITALMILLLTTPLSKVTEKLIDKLFEDTELRELEKEKLKQEVIKLQKENGTYVFDNPTIRKKRSNFYETLDKETQVQKVYFESCSGKDTKEIKSQFVSKSEFKNFVLVTDELEPENIDEAVIEIISPVLKKGNYKWSGYYNSEVIYFSMKSNEFKTAVQNGRIEFKNGSTINCNLVIKRKVNNDGLIKLVGYEVSSVNSYYSDDIHIETSEGRSKRFNKEKDRTQLKLFVAND